MFVTSDEGSLLLKFVKCSFEGGRQVDLALRLNVLAVLAAIVFISAILLGAF
jgi:hypothetical protein